jgi:pimeloyl-ACP methyl ester carboxylesterase
VYGAFRIVQDLEQLRRALNHRRMLLWGISHGTVVANHYAAMHPARVEAMLLDGPYPPDPTANAPTLGFREGLAGATAACRSKPICGPARDRLTEAYERAYAALAREPMALDVPGFGRCCSTPTISRCSSRTRSIRACNGRSRRRDAPCHRARADRRRGSARRRLASRIAAGPDAPARLRSARRGVRHRRMRRPHALPRPRAGALTGVELIDLGTVCPWWNARTTEPARMPTGRGIPALVLTGSTDPITPPGYVAATVRRLGAGARMLIVPGAGHGTVRSTPCGRAAAAAFFADPARAAPPLAHDIDEEQPFW